MHLVADAPTGLGKTIAALFPAVEYAVNNDKTVIFLTSRLSQHRACIEALKRMKSAGNTFKATDIIGKKHLCSHDVSDMDASMFSNFCSGMVSDKKCNFYKNFWRKDYTTHRTEMFKVLLDNGPTATQEAMHLVSNIYCTYEMLMETAKSSDVIIADYFHMFGMDEKFFRRMEKSLEDTIIIVDEAHNLTARLRSLTSSKLSTRTCDLALKEAKSSELRSYIQSVQKALQKIAKKHFSDGNEVFITKEEFVSCISADDNNIYNNIITELTSASKQVLQQKSISYMDRVANFLSAWQGNDFGYARILSRERLHNENHIRLQYNCLDPSLISKRIMHSSHSTILMSGTLSPTEMHRDLLGMDHNRTMMKYYESPFPKQNRKNIVVTGITTKYSKRTEENFQRIADTVKSCINGVNGNIAVFFPSYQIRDHIYGLLGSIGKHVIMEDRKMTKADRDGIKDRIEANNGTVLFGVMGGSFSEGIDLPGLLKCVIIIGLPLDKRDLSIDALIDYYEQRFQNGINYGYLYPAMIKVMQAAGRCIRSETDRGVIIFADERFTWKNYREIFPKSWRFVITDRPEAEIKNFSF